MMDKNIFSIYPDCYFFFMPSSGMVVDIGLNNFVYCSPEGAGTGVFLDGVGCYGFECSQGECELESVVAAVPVDFFQEAVFSSGQDFYQVFCGAGVEGGDDRDPAHQLPDQSVADQVVPGGFKAFRF